MNILTPSDVYYANAKSAIEGEKRSIAAEKIMMSFVIMQALPERFTERLTASYTSGSSQDTALLQTAQTAAFSGICPSATV